MHATNPLFFAVNILSVYIVSDFRYSDQWPVRGHDSQGEAAALVSENDRRLPGHSLRQLHHQLERWQALQRCYSQALVSVQFYFFHSNNSIEYKVEQWQTGKPAPVCKHPLLLYSHYSM